MQPNGITRTAEIVYIAMILAVAALVWREASALPPAPYDSLGPKSFPIWISYGLAALGGVMLVRLVLGRSLGSAAQSMVVGLDEAVGEGARQPWRAIATLILAFAYATALSFRSVGFLPATAVYLFLSGVVLGPIERRRLLMIAIFAVAAAALLDLVFRAIFKLDLS
jgi:hypothetical protein